MQTSCRNKKRYVYLDKPPYITASNYCENHKTLSVRVEIPNGKFPNEPEEIFREDGLKMTNAKNTKDWWNKVFADMYP